MVSKVLIMNEFSKAKLDMTSSVPMKLLLRMSHGGEKPRSPVLWSYCLGGKLYKKLIIQE